MGKSKQRALKRCMLLLRWLGRMREKSLIEQRSRNTFKLAMIVLICLLLTYCAHSLNSAPENNGSATVSVNQEIPQSAVPQSTGSPLIGEKNEVITAADISPSASEALKKEAHRQEKRPVAPKNETSQPFTSLAPHNRDSGQPQEATSSTPQTTIAIKNALDNQGPVISPTDTHQNVAGSVAQVPDIPQGSREEHSAETFGATFTEPISGMEFVLVKGGCYQMGSDLTAFEGPVHEVCVDDFYLAKYEVTQMQWTKIMGRHFSYFKGNLRPIERATWDDSQIFISQLNSRSGATYRLPTEAEWEYSARSGGADKVYSGTGDEESLQRFAWYVVNSNRETHMVGMKKPNSLGLYDMSGNVWEWCSDWYGDSYYAKSPRNNPQGPDTGIYRVIRGGEWELPAALTRTTYRDAEKPHVRRNDIGFRLALSLPNKSEQSYFSNNIRE